MTASALIGVIPEDLIETEVQIQQEKLKELAEKMTPRRPPAAPARQPRSVGGGGGRLVAPAASAPVRGSGRGARGGGGGGAVSGRGRDAPPTRRVGSRK